MPCQSAKGRYSCGVSTRNGGTAANGLGAPRPAPNQALHGLPNRAASARSRPQADRPGEPDWSVGRFLVGRFPQRRTVQGNGSTMAEIASPCTLGLRPAGPFWFRTGLPFAVARWGVGRRHRNARQTHHPLTKGRRSFGRARGGDRSGRVGVNSTGMRRGPGLGKSREYCGSFLPTLVT
jgi:hypothetical protein